ncbi:MAG: glycosyltransferase family 2 protein [Candidatus Eiseniibacteriota bacterium]|nr:MAG: glycosyltransferase family 2 protein [Candidatus Eisenbacteria bacterium]
MGEKLTVIIPTFNEEGNVRECLESVSWAHEIIVVDSFSSDSTVAICREHGATVLKHEYRNSAAQKNWVLPRASNAWVLIVDADERVTEPLRREILKLLEGGPECDGYWVRRRNRFFGRDIRFCGWQRDKVLRFFNRHKGKYEEKHVHAEVCIEGRVGALKNHLVHDSYESFSAYLRKLDRYTDWGARDAAEEGRPHVLARLVFRPPARFVRMYFLQLGFLDGLEGFILCWLAAVSVFLKYAKLWRLVHSEGRRDGGL